MTTLVFRRGFAPQWTAHSRNITACLSIALDFQANTVSIRHWMRSLIDQSGAAHELHLLDVPDTICKQRLRERNAAGEHPWQISEAEYDLFTSHFVPPGPNEGFNVIVHTS